MLFDTFDSRQSKMRIKITSIFFISVLFLLRLKAATDYKGESLPLILGTTVSSPEFKAFAKSWLLDDNLENNLNGIKVYLNQSSNTVESILIVGESLKMNDIIFSECSSMLPFGISLKDNAAALKAKLGEGQKIGNNTLIKYFENNVGVDVLFSNPDFSKIRLLKFYLKPPAPSSSFRQAILDVFSSYRDSNLSSIKATDRTQNNFWKYKFTYNTKLKIPGEAFNMLYRFPFNSSPLDFVSVIKESDTYDSGFEKVYKDFERQLMRDFPASDGWIASCVPNKESKTISDLEFRNDKYGAVVLDYSQNPSGKHILYLRFLLFSN